MPATAPQAPPQVYHGIPLHCNWAPDAHALNVHITHEASGVLPAPYGYTFWPMGVQQSAAMEAKSVGAFTVRKTDGGLAVYSGTISKLFRYTSTTVWTDVSRLAGGAYNVASDHTWSFAQFGNLLFATNVNDVLQYIDVDAGSNFAAVSGSPPQARIVRAVGDFLMLGGLSSNPTRVMWCGRNNTSFWTAGTQDCDFQDFRVGGWVRGIVPFGNGRGLVLLDTAIYAFAPSGDGKVFTFQLIEVNHGLVSTDSLVTHGGTAYYLSRHGFYATDGAGQSRPIGADRVNNFFADEVESTRLTFVQGAIDPSHPRIFWAFPSSGNTTDLFDHVLCYDIDQDAWSHCDQITSSYIFPAASLGFNIDDIDAYLTANGWTIETVPFSFDAAFLTGGTPVLAYFDEDFKLAFQNGAPFAAEMETADWQLNQQGGRAFLRGLRPLADTTAATVAVGVKERAQGSPTFTSESSQDARGFCPLRCTGVYFTFRVTIPAGTTWHHFHGFEIETNVVSAGRR